MKEKGWYWLVGAFVVGVGVLAAWMHCQGREWTPLITAQVLALAAVIAYRQLQHARHTRCAELLLDIMKWWNSNEITKSKQLLWKMEDAKSEVPKLYKAKDEKFTEVIRLGQFAESLGVLVKKNYIDKKDIWSLFEDAWKRYYEYFSGYLQELKDSDPDDTTFCNFKLLCEELDKIKN